MKPLFVPIFVLLTVTVHADQYVVPSVWYSDVPMSERVTLREMPAYFVPNSIVTVVSDTVYVEERIATPVPYTAAKPPEMPMTLPQPLTEPLVPFLPIQNRPLPEEATTATTEVVRGQMGETVGGILDTPAPVARGPVADGTIDPKLLEPVASDLEGDSFAGSPVSSHPVPPATATLGQPSGTQPADPLGYGVLAFAMIITTLGLIYVAFVAYDYRQRWLQSMTMQNNYYIGGTFDLDTEDTYSGAIPLSDGFGLRHRSI